MNADDMRQKTNAAKDAIVARRKEAEAAKEREYQADKEEAKKRIPGMLNAALHDIEIAANRGEDSTSIRVADYRGDVVNLLREALRQKGFEVDWATYVPRDHELLSFGDYYYFKVLWK